MYSFMFKYVIIIKNLIQRNQQMKNLRNLFLITTTLFLSFNTVQAQSKYLILAEGDSWKPLMASNLTENYVQINRLPFSGFVMVGNTFTNKVMKVDVNVSYASVWAELQSLQGLYPNKRNFLQINIDFPADFWNDEAWERVSSNFKTVAQVAKDLNFTGIAFDDEPYSKSAMRMVNFKFPNKNELSFHSKTWEIKGSQDSWVDENAYANKYHSFAEHMEKVTERFKNIMQKMEEGYPSLTLLIYNGASYAHENTNKEHTILTDVGLAREHEYKGAIFAGFVKGEGDYMEIHDMGESYKYRKDEHFRYAYEWRKKNISKDRFNDDLDPTYQWRIPENLRSQWSRSVSVGFMVYNKGQESNEVEFDTRGHSTKEDIAESLKLALAYSDKYVIYYEQGEAWLLPNQEEPIASDWYSMMQEIYNSIQ